MLRDQLNPLLMLTKAPPGRHFAQLHRESASLAKSVGVFIDTGLGRGETALVIARPTHVELFLRQLRDRGMDPDDFIRTGRLIVLDAQTTLDRFMRGNTPNWRDFRNAVGAVLDVIQASQPRGIRAYGEMVDILWQRGNHDAAIRLEEFWNRLATEYSFALFCCYMLDGLADHSYAGPLHEIGRTHSDILAGEDDERFGAAVDAASSDIFGSPLSRTLSSSGREDHDGEHRLPIGRRTMLWIQRNMPASAATVLGRARALFLQAEVVAGSTPRE